MVFIYDLNKLKTIMEKCLWPTQHISKDFQKSKESGKIAKAIVSYS